MTGGDPNLFAGNDVGILVTGSGSTGNRIIGNLVGSDPSGGTGAGNASSGVRIAQGAGGTVVGGTGPGEGNLITASGGDGVAVVDDTTVGNAITGNSIHDNGGLGIDLGDDGVDPTPPAIFAPDCSGYAEAAPEGAASKLSR